MNTQKKYYTQKIVRSGGLIERYVYELPVSVKRSTHPDYVKPVGRAKTADQQNKRKNREATLRRNKKEVARYLHSNAYKWANEDGEVFLPVLVTLTFDENLEDVQHANKLFKRFIQRFNYAVYRKKVSGLKYLAVIEFQKRGAIHYHCVFFNLPFVDVGKLNEIWKHGNANIERVRSIGKLTTYLTKKMKGVGDERLARQKNYLNSKGLRKPENIIDDRRIADILGNSTATYSAEFESDYYGKINYERRKMNKPKK